MDTVTPKERSRIMAKVKSKANKSTEMKMVKIFRDQGLKGWRRNSTLPGKPDFVYPAYKIAIFVDGCFWHACPKHCRMPNTNQEYWIKKIDRNKTRDKTVLKMLKEKGWKTIRIWEHEINTPQMTRKLKPVRDNCEK